MGKFYLSRPFWAAVIPVFLSAGPAAAQLVAPASTVGKEINTPVEGARVESSIAASLPRQIKVEPVPTIPSDGFFRKAASKTPSGFEVPRYVSLKFGKVNGRTGPSINHSIAWQYRRRDLPLVVVAETEMWRKVRDINGGEAWVRKPALSGERYVMAMEETLLLSEPESGSHAVARSETGALFKLEECNDDGWCRVKAKNGLKGWASRRQLWGAQIL